MTQESRRCRVLLVEDEFLLCDMVAEALIEHGFEVHAVANGEDAVRHLGSGAPCDVLLTDINLPGALDGTALAERARVIHPDLPVVYATGSAHRIEQIRAVTGSVLVPKPYDPNKLCAMLGHMLAN